MVHGLGPTRHAVRTAIYVNYQFVTAGWLCFGRAIRFRVVLFSTDLQDAIARRRTLFFPPVNVNGEKVGWEGKGKGRRHSRAMVVPPSIMSHECDLSITETEVSSLPASLFAYCFHLA
jgi:hypothetical protein